MKRVVTASLLLGYVMLVPFCFFGSMMTANETTMMHMSSGATHSMNDCGMVLGGCTQGMETNGVDAAVHHIGMYNAITQTPLSGISLIIAFTTIFFLLALSLPSYWHNSMLRVQQSFRPARQRSKHLRSGVEQRILTWLSLFEASPNFA